MALRSDYARDILAFKVEQLLWHIAQIEARQPADRVLRPDVAVLSRLRCRVPRAVPSAVVDADDSDAGPAPLRPGCSIVHMITSATPEAVMLLDCRALAEPDLLHLWRNWPRESLQRGTVPVFILSVPPLDQLVREGAAMEWLAPSDSEGDDAFRAQTLDFIKAKYGADRIVPWTLAVPAGAPAGSPA